ncbi:hypothetical protein BCR22_06290 [Enterococcus plantarum]|nr:competence type IV pilus minor pilin ComGE [Enterococcus plantarum]MBO0423493.1 type II secretion system protein [Enterococcus plantarum]MBO0468030.1 type II secretion system protein [Enterococcus plantarum]OEG10060.1 hypothetical protein BCR22_06290 [Enterococcus plantarum]
MLRKSTGYSGYVFLESLIALGLMCLIIGSYLSLNTFLLKKNKHATNQLILYRVLYEEMKHFENYGGPLLRDIHTENGDYQLRVYQVANKLIEVEVIGENEHFEIKKE